MAERRTTRPITATQILGVMAISLALYCVVAFGTKSVEAYRLVKWRDQLQAEIGVMEREADHLRQEIERRRSPSYLDQALREAGMVPDKVVRVIVVPVTPDANPRPVGVAPTLSPPPLDASQLFHNPNWEAWRALLLRFDE